MDNKPVTLAAISGAHGVAGEVRLKLFGAGVKSRGSFVHFNEGTLTLVKVRDDNKGGAIARFAEITDRGKAEHLRGTALTVPRSSLPQLRDDEFYYSDLIGLPVETGDGTHVGRVVSVHNYGATDLAEIVKEPEPAKGQKTFMVPLIKDAVPEWDDKRIVINADFIA